MPITETGTRARLPDSNGYATAGDGIRLYYEVFGSGEKTIVMLPCETDLSFPAVEATGPLSRAALPRNRL
jgi:hypothetical protein